MRQAFSLPPLDEERPAPVAGLRLVMLPREPEVPAACLVIEQGQVVRQGDLVPGEPYLGGPTVLVVPGEEATARWLDLPVQREAQATAAAALLLEEELAAPRDSLHIALGPAEADGQRLAVVVGRERMQSWLDAAADLGIEPDRVTPDHLLLPEPGEGEPAVAAGFGGTCAVRGFRLALSCDEDLAPLVMTGQPYRILKDSAELVRGMAAAPAFDLRQGAFGPARAGGEGGFRRAAVLAGLLVLALLAVPAVEAVRHGIAAASAENRIEALAGPGAGEPIARLRARLSGLQASERFPSAAAALFAAVEGVPGMELQALIYGEDGRFRLSVRHPNYTDVDTLRNALGRARLGVKETSAVREQGWILSDLVVEPQP